MIQLFFDGETIDNARFVDNFDFVKTLLEKRNELNNIKLENIIELINEFSKNILIDSQTREIEGIAFLSQWLRKTNIQKILEINFENPKILDDYVEKKDKLLIAQPKGLIGHWIAGNVIILGVFSLIQSILVKNANILRIPLASMPIMLKFIEILNKTEINSLKGSQLLCSTALIYYPKEEKEHNTEFSKLCDARIVWGGEEAVKAISNTEKKETCEDIIFGPKYSFAVIDKESLNDKNELDKEISKFVYDIIFSEQDSCTSPQVLFCETDFSGLREIALIMKKSFENLSERFSKKNITMSEASNILRIRGEYAVDDSKDLIASKGNNWTILIDDKFQLEEPIKSRTIFLKPCKNINDVCSLITPKIQTIGYSIKNKEKIINFSKTLNLLGVSRLVPFGQMNYYDSPWDGKLLLTRLVNFNSLKLPLDLK